eukprot:357077-Chlamydomonas_euryale.AAC.5
MDGWMDGKGGGAHSRCREEERLSVEVWKYGWQGGRGALTLQRRRVSVGRSMEVWVARGEGRTH